MCIGLVDGMRCCSAASWRPHLFLFFFNDTATTEIYTLSLHDALPIFDDLTPPVDAPFSEDGSTPKQGAMDRLTARQNASGEQGSSKSEGFEASVHRIKEQVDRKSTRLNSSHPSISYAVFCLKKKKKTK